jgi:hypothetical protein
MLLAVAPPSEEATLGSNPMVGPSPKVPSGSSAGLLEHSPQAFLVRNAPDRRTNVHYHPVDQFQVFVDGSGRIGRHAIQSQFIHYVDHYQPYGPIIAGSEGLSYLTLRAWSDCGIWYLPESKGALAAAAADRSSQKRNLSFELGGVTFSSQWSWLADEDDGLRIGVCEVGPGSVVSLPTISGDGAWVLVVTGAISMSDVAVSSGSAIYLGIREDAPIVSVPPGGGAAGLALLQFPKVGSI